MFGDMSFVDALRACRAISTNQIARAAPRAYFRAVKDTGRGPSNESPEDLAQYCLRSVSDYERVLHSSVGDGARGIVGSRVLEYGPGDFLGVAVVLVAKGASDVTCVDRFPLFNDSSHNIAAYQAILAELRSDERQRAEQCFRTVGRPESGLDPARVCYEVQRSGLSGMRDAFDLVLSRAVLEHVDDLPATFRDMRGALRPSGRAVHLVDLSSHRLHRRNPLDFLTYPDWLWSLMYSHKGVPNRHRLDSYRDAIARTGLRITKMEASKTAPREWIEEVRPHLAPRFRGLTDEELACLGFWLVCTKAVE
jgi:SAM-dependent methyltransferase